MKKFLKRITCGLITTIMLLTFFGCGINNQEDVNTNNKKDVSANSQEKVSTNNLEDVIIGTWDVSWSRDEDYTFRNDGSIKISNNGSLGDFKYKIDGNMLYIYYTYGDYDFSDEEEEEYEVKEDKDGNYYVIRSRLEYAFEVEIISNDSLKLYEINDDGTKTNVVEYMDRIS